MTQSRICRHLRHPKESYIIDSRGRQKRTDHTAIDLCGYPVGVAPPPVVRFAVGGTPLNDGDCDACPLFDSAEVPAWANIGT